VIGRDWAVARPACLAVAQNTERLPARALLFVTSPVLPLLSESIRLRFLRVLLELLEFLKGGVLLEVSHIRRVIVPGRRLIVHAQAGARQVPFSRGSQGV
jgi:hypothetical protein